MSPYFACLVVIVSVGTGVFWSGRKQLISQAFALITIFTAAWIYIIWTLTSPWKGNPVPWLRAAAAVGDFFPWLIWWTGRCAINPHGSWRDLFSAGRYWMVSALILAALAVSPWFIPAESTSVNRIYGPGYLPHQIGQFCAYLALPICTVADVTRLKGFGRYLGKLLLVGGGVATVVAAAITILAPRMGYPELARGAPAVGLALYLVLAWTISSQQMLDTRHRMLTVLRRVIGLIGAAYLITWMLERTWNGPREVQVLMAMAGGIAFALGFDLLTGTIVGHFLAGHSKDVARSLQRFATDVAAMPTAQLREGAAQKIAKTLSCQQVAVYWRHAPDHPLRLVSVQRTPPGCPAMLPDDHTLLRQSARERGPWWISRRLDGQENSFLGFALCVPVFELDKAFLLLLTGHKQSPLGFTQQELSALQAWALACHHTFTARAMLERENAQQQLVYAGKLAAGFAHNLRNPLAVVRAYLEADPAMARAQMDELHALALQEGARVQSTIDGLTALSRGERFELSPQDLRSLVAQAVESNRTYLAECHATVEISGPEDGLTALAEPWQLKTALTNLLRNSAEEVARDGGGWIRIGIGASSPGWVEVTVRDSGLGLPAHIRDAVFSRDLFARTTKSTASPGRRTGFGIGLHSTMLIVTIGHGGRFEYHDGAFVVSLPLAPTASFPVWE